MTLRPGPTTPNALSPYVFNRDRPCSHGLKHTRAHTHTPPQLPREGGPRLLLPHFMDGSQGPKQVGWELSAAAQDLVPGVLGPPGKWGSGDPSPDSTTGFCTHQSPLGVSRKTQGERKVLKLERMKSGVAGPCLGARRGSSPRPAQRWCTRLASPSSIHPSVCLSVCSTWSSGASRVRCSGIQRWVALSLETLPASIPRPPRVSSSGSSRRTMAHPSPPKPRADAAMDAVHGHSLPSGPHCHFLPKMQGLCRLPAQPRLFLVPGDPELKQRTRQLLGGWGTSLKVLFQPQKSHSQGRLRLSVDDGGETTAYATGQVHPEETGTGRVPGAPPPQTVISPGENRNGQV